MYKKAKVVWPFDLSWFCFLQKKWNKLIGIFSLNSMDFGPNRTFLFEEISSVWKYIIAYAQCVSYAPELANWKYISWFMFVIMSISI